MAEEKTRRTKFYRRRILILLSAMGLGIFTGVIGVLYSNSPVTLQLSEGDIILLPVSTFFCEGIEIRSHETGVKVSKLPYIPDFSKKRWIYQSKHEFVLQRNTFVTWSAYLLKQSVITVKVCSDDSTVILVFQGRGNFNRWKSDHTYSEYIYQSETYGTHNCKLPRNNFIFQLKVTEEDNYFFVYWHTAGVLPQAKVSALVTFNRTLYDTSRSVLVCDSLDPDTSCYPELQFASLDITMVEVLQSVPKTDYFQMIKVTYHPKPRIWFYSALFGGIFCFFAVAYITLSLLSKILKSKDEQTTEEQEGLIENEQMSRSIALHDISHESEVEEDFVVNSYNSLLTVNYTQRQTGSMNGDGTTPVMNSCLTAGLSAV